MKNRFLASLLSISLAASAFVMPVYAEESTDITSYQSSFDFNVSNWGIVGETVAEDTNFVSSNGFVFETAAKVKSSYTMKPFTVTTAEDGTVTYPENGDEITFHFDKATASANVNNAYETEKGGSAIISDVGRYAKRVYFIAESRGNHTNPLTITTTYKDGTTQIRSLTTENRGQGSWNKRADYAGDFGVTANRLGNISWRYAYKGADNTILHPSMSVNNVKDYSSSGGGLLYAFDVDSTKIIDKIEFSCVSSTTSMVLYAMLQTIMSNAEMNAVIDEAEKITEINAETSAQLNVARAYADELILRNAATESDFAVIDALIAEAQWYAQKTDGEQNMIDLSDKFNIDTIAPEGSQVAAAWDTSLLSANPTAWGKSWKLPYNGDVVSTYSDGIRSVNEHEYILNDDGTTYSFTQNGNVINFSMPQSTFDAGVNDTVKIPGGSEAINVKASGNFVNKVYFIWTSTGSYSEPGITVNYEDGSSETIRFNMCAFNYVNTAEKLKKRSYPNLVSGGFFAWNKYKAQKNENDELYTVVVNGSGEAGVTVFGAEVDASKKVVSYDILPCESYVTYLYAMTEAPVTNAELQAVIDEARNIEIVKTEEEAALAKKAAAYARELDARHVVKLEDNADILGLANQAEAQDVKYVDLTSMVDTDIIVKVDEERPASYNGRDDLLINADKNSIASGIVSLGKPSDSEYSSYAADTTFKLSGGYEGNGNDAVAIVKGGEDVTFSIDGDVVKKVAVLTDNLEGSADKGTTVYVTVNYTDGTTDDITSKIFRTSSWYTGQYAARKDISFAHYDEATNKYADGKLTTAGEITGAYLTGFAFDVPSFKEVASVTLKASTLINYNVLAITAAPYTNGELEDKFNEFADTGITEASEVNASNAQIVADGCFAMTELYNRGYNAVTADDMEWLAGLYSEALKYLLEGEILSFTPAVAVSGNVVTASVNMTNTTQADEDYVLIVAAYGTDNKLLGFETTEQKKLNANTPTASDSISMNVPSGAVSYKAMVWKSLSGMTPVAVAAK